MNKEIIIKYYEDSFLQNQKLISLPISITKGKDYITDNQIFDSIINDSIFLENFNPALGMYIITNPNSLEKKDLDKTIFKISEPLIFMVKRKFPFEDYIEEMIMAFGDQKTLLQHIEEVRGTMEESDKRSLVGLRYFDSINKGYIKVNKYQEIPLKNLLMNGKYTIMVEKRHEREVDDFLLVDLDIEEDKFVFVGNISNEIKKNIKR